MPAIGRTNKPEHVERAQRRRRRPKPKPYRRPAPKTQPGPFRQSERRAVRRYERRQPRSPAFRALPKNNAPFRAQRKQARRKAERADRRIPRSTAVPRIPVLRHYTKPQRQAIRRIYKRAARRVGTSPAGLYQLGSAQQRREMSTISRRVVSDEHRAAGFDPRRRVEFHVPARRSGAGSLFATVGTELAERSRIPGMAAGSTTSIGHVLRRAALPAEVAFNIGRATVEDPEAVARSSLRTARESIAGIPQGVKMLVEDPEKALRAMADDYERRYGSILKDPKGFRQMVKNDYGITPFALDAAALAGGTGQAAGIVARSGAAARLTRLPGKAGQAARVIHEASRAEKARPRLRFSAGEEGTRAQRVSRNLFVASAQRRLDVRRAGRHRRRVERAGFIEEPGGRMLRAPGREALPGRLPGLRPGRGEVVGRGLRDVGPWRGLTGRIQRDIGQTKSTTRIRLLTHRGRVVREIARKTSKLTDAEKMGVALMLKYGLRSGRQSLATVRKRLAQIDTRELAQARREGGLDDQEVRALKTVLANPDMYLTGRAKAAADGLRDIQLREVANDPSLADDQELIRRLSQQAELLDVPKNLKSGEKAPDVSEMDRAVAMAEDLAEQQRKTKTFKVHGKTIHMQKIANGLRESAEAIRRGDDPDLDSPDKSEVVKDVKDFEGRVHKAAEEANLDEPAYWMSTAEAVTGARLRAVGTGLKATERNRRYTGGLYRAGAEDIGLDVFTQGVERNIKRRFQWQMVARNIETHAFEWSRNRGQGKTFSQIASELRKRSIDPESVDFIPATIVRRRPDVQEGIQRGRPMEAIPEGEEFGDVHQAVKKRLSWQELSSDETQSAPMFRYFAVPKEVGEVLEAAIRPSGGTARTLEIILKQKPTRIMLGALNVPWLGFQVVSNGILTGLGGGLKPWDIFGAHKWFRGLDHEAKEAIEAELGITHGHHFALDQPHLGDVKAPFGVRHLMAAFRGFRRTKVGRGLHKANPLDLMFKLDEAQNNFWRKSLFYSKAKKAVYQRMGQNWRQIDRTQQSIVDRVFRLPPDDAVRAVAENADLFERHAKHVRDWLGDYTRFSNAERKLLQAHVLFYGYLRFSLRFAFYTMPVEHPVMADMIGNIGRMGAQEVKDLFGVPSNYGMPTSMLAQAYFGDRQDTKRGTLRSVNFGRMNPFLNAVTQMESLRQSAGLVSPLYQDLLDQAFEESSFTGREWRIGGKPTPGEAERPRSYFGSPLSLLNPGAYAIPRISEGRPRNRILQEQLLSMAFPYRLAEQTGVPGTNIGPLSPSQSDDALLWSPRPMGYKDEEAKAGVARTRREAKGLSFEQRLLQGASFLPKTTAAPQVIEREREKEADLRNRKMSRRKRRSNPYGSGSSRYGGGNRSNFYGGSSSSRYGG